MRYCDRNLDQIHKMLARLLKLNMPIRIQLQKVFKNKCCTQVKTPASSVNEGAYIFQQSYSSATGLVDGVTNIFMAQGTSVCNI